LRPIRALLDSSTDMIRLNYAVPVGAIDDTQATTAALAALRRAFPDHRRRLRFKFNESTSFQLQAPHPPMVCTPHSSRRFAAQFAMRLLGGDDPSQPFAAAPR